MPTPPSLVAVDLGASSGRVLAGRLEAGRLTTHEAGRFPNRPVRAGGRLHWDVLALWAGVQDGLRAAARAHGPVASVGIDTWAVDYGLLDAHGDLLGNPVHYRDGRTAGAADAFARLLDPAAHYAATGSQVQPFNTVYQLLAAGSAAGSATSPRAADRLLLVPDLLGRWLSGTEATEVTNASTTGMLDPATRRWSPAVLDALAASPAGDVRRLLAPLVEPGTVLGPVLAGADGLDGRDGLDGLDGAVHVAVGSHDTASAVAAVPIGDAPAAWISSGTWSLVGVELPAPVLTPAGRAANFTNELGVAGTVRYLRNVAGLWLLQESLRCWADAGAPQDLTTLLAAAADVPALRTVVDVDDPAFAPPGDMPARIAAAARRTGQPVPERPAEVARCVLDSLALAYRRAVRQAASLSGRDVRVVHVVGGGARNALLCRLTAEATGLPVVAGPVEATAIGNLLTQALALGELSGGLTAVREVVRASSELVTHRPGGSEQPWARAEERLWP
ncbi:rhamnulokinase [Cellulomonas sp. ACRRI]|uniref:rhamnulokinase n=1 Tax=Cellulomonas sp. ACRRI TaxID=2918188 RepID=UPI001EF161AC|nr:rhamnulokinase family protein [Cellulomonas sp. ACRRI]MCG7287496.1 rhamnulokinase [Cellulomonas sp. ACRRI]